MVVDGNAKCAACNYRREGCQRLALRIAFVRLGEVEI
jgi:hypothetical protein